ncbi:DUF4383 domain-containing protein [Microlunatus kandeliicorticis]|uniref:DUF4383 domain-containing protein n=1 Tax=Microlunatus kandeliicorticis TaxID=1759536 RepID=UPI0015F8DE09|nr:DUF4383 domain-containing protein [Microlunatus kandeliicorticis]
MAETAGSTEQDTGARRRPAPVQQGAGALAFLLAGAGVLGFVPGVTTHVDQLALLGPRSGALLFDLVRVSVLVNVVHLVVGLVGLVAARRGPRPSVRWFVGVAVVFFILFVIGVETGPHSTTNPLPVNAAATFTAILVVIVAVLGIVFLNRTGPDVVREVFVSDRPVPGADHPGPRALTAGAPSPSRHG